MDKEKKEQLAALGLKARVFDKLIQLMEQARLDGELDELEVYAKLIYEVWYDIGFGDDEEVPHVTT